MREPRTDHQVIGTDQQLLTARSRVANLEADLDGQEMLLDEAEAAGADDEVANLTKVVASLEARLGATRERLAHLEARAEREKAKGGDAGTE